MTTKVALSTPIKAHGKDISEVEFRELTTADLIDLGEPRAAAVAGNAKDVTIKVLPSVIADYIVRLGNIPPSSVKALSVKDFRACQAVVLGFFNESEEQTEALAN